MNRHNDKNIKDLVSSFISHYKLKPKYMEFKIREYWMEEMNPMVNRYTMEIKVVNKKLIVSISSASVKHELNLDRTKIKDQINEFLGEKFLLDVMIR